MARKKKKEEHVNHERWLVSYADFMTLLFALFTAMYAISTVDAKKAGQLVFSTRAAFNLDFFPTKDAVLGSVPPVDSLGQPTPKAPKEKPIPNIVSPPPKIALMGEGGADKALVRQAIDTLRKLVAEDKLDTSITVKKQPNSIVISLRGQAFFDEGTAHLKKEALPVLDKVAKSLLPVGLAIRVEGHTDDTPSRDAQYPSNWDLSAGRAVSVVRYLTEEYAFPPDHLAVAGYGSGHPVSDNQSPEGRERNRRVDLVILNTG